MKMKILLSMALLMTFLTDGRGQTPPPPPPPLIYAAPTIEEIKELVFEECGYAISIAGELQMGRHPGACSYIGTKRKGSSASFRIIRFSEEDLKKHPPDEVFEKVKNAYLTPGRFRLTDKKVVEVLGEKGLEFSADDGIQHRRLRAFIKDKVLYEFYIDVTNWHILTKYHPAATQAFEAEVSRFFNSLRLLSRK